MSDQREACQPSWAEAVDRAWLGAASGEELRELYTHLAGCELCRARFDRLALVDHAAAESESLDAAARDRVEGAIFGAVSTGAVERPAWMHWAFMFGGSIAAIAGLIFFAWPVGDDPFRARSGDSLPVLSLYCIAPLSATRVQPQIRVAVVMSESAPTAACRVDDDLQIAYSKGQEGPSQVRITAELPDGSRRGIAPLSLDGWPLELKSEVTNEVVPYSRKLDSAGIWKVVARFEGHEATLSATLEIEP